MKTTWIDIVIAIALENAELREENEELREASENNDLSRWPPLSKGGVLGGSDCQAADLGEVFERLLETKRRYEQARRRATAG